MIIHTYICTYIFRVYIITIFKNIYSIVSDLTSLRLCVRTYIIYHYHNTQEYI